MVNRPNLHFAVRSSNLLWTNATCPLEEYLEYWQNEGRNNRIVQVKRNKWGAFLKILKDLNMFSEEDEQEFNRKILTKKYPNINVCPGVRCNYIWKKNDAIDLDDKGNFIQGFKDKIKECFGTW